MREQVMIELGDGPLQGRNVEIPKDCDECFLLCPDGVTYAHYLRLHTMLTNEDGTKYFQPCPHLLPTGMEVFFQKPPENLGPATQEPQKYRGVLVDGRDLMIHYAKQANMEWAGIKRMVLVMELDAAPLLYVESFLCKDAVPPPEELKPDVIVGPCPVIDTTSMQNKVFRTKEPREAHALQAGFVRE